MNYFQFIRTTIGYLRIISYHDTPIGVSKGVFLMVKKHGIDIKTGQTQPIPSSISGSNKKGSQGGGGSHLRIFFQLGVLALTCGSLELGESSSSPIPYNILNHILYVIIYVILYILYGSVLYILYTLCILQGVLLAILFLLGFSQFEFGEHKKRERENH